MRTRLGTLLTLASAIALVACPTLPLRPKVKPGPTVQPLPIEVVAKVTTAPGNITVLPDGRPLVSLHQFFLPTERLALIEGKAGQAKLVPYEIPGVTLDAVLGLQVDKQGELWLLDNGLASEQPPRVLRIKDPSKPRRPRIYALKDALAERSFINDLAVDRRHGKVFIADPAPGKAAALIVLDIKSGKARRVLQGHGSVVAEDIDLAIDGKVLTVKTPKGIVKPRIGVNPIALDTRDEWLYFGPMHGRTLYRVRVEHLIDDALIPSELARKVERYAKKPICDGITLDQRGNVYLGDLAHNAIGVILAKDRSYRLVARGPAYSWIDAFAFGADGKLYTVAVQLQRSAHLNGGVAAPKPPFLVLRLTPLAPGILGR